MDKNIVILIICIVMLIIILLGVRLLYGTSTVLEHPGVLTPGFLRLCFWRRKKGEQQTPV